MPCGVSVMRVRDGRNGGAHKNLRALHLGGRREGSSCHEREDIEELHGDVDICV